MNDELKTKSRALQDAVNNEAACNRMEKEAQAVIDEVLARNDLQDPNEQKRLADARNRMEIVFYQRKKRTVDLPALAREVDKLLSAARAEFNKRVRAARDAKLAELEAVLKPFYPDQARRCHKEAEALDPPAIHAFSKMFAGAPFRPDEKPEDRPGNVMRDCEDFFARTKRISRMLGWDKEGTAGAAAAGAGATATGIFARMFM
jgi:hypothetical protein